MAVQYRWLKPPLTHGVPAFIAPPPDRGTVNGGSESKESLHYEINFEYLTILINHRKIVEK
uniref:hypothetical protein n=1 Tax=Escherichia coli TaxID=562 RepID=UPI00155D93DA|nr:hypothetical protein [Escherichia coli]